MIFSIASVDKNMGIGKDGKLLCRLRADMAFFREKTLGKTVVMGRKRRNLCRRERLSRIGEILS